MKDNFKILKLEYLSNHRSDLTQIQVKIKNQTKIENYLQWRRPPIEDDLEVLDVEYLSNHWSYLTQIWNLRLGDQTKI